MSALVATLTTRNILDEWIARYYGPLANDLDEALPGLQGTQNLVRIEVYTPYLAAPNSWLPVVEERIRASVLPEEFEGEVSSEWLTEDAAYAAIAFFRAGADLLPSEPYIYGTNLGDLVAEFETKNGSLTSVVSDKETILFAVIASDPHEPIQKVIRRGSNQFRHELRAVTNRLSLGRHGKMEAAR